MKKTLVSVLSVVIAVAFIWAWQTYVDPAATVSPTATSTTTAPQPEPGTEPAPEPAGDLTGDLWTVVHVFDGDTMEVERGGVREKVRIIGIDTPERGECGSDDAREMLGDLIGEEVSLIRGAETDRDPYDRMLRYVEWPSDGDDYGLFLIEEGFAISRFDSRSNQPHDREVTYWQADADATRICPDSAWDRGY